MLYAIFYDIGVGQEPAPFYITYFREKTDRETKNSPLIDSIILEEV